jgi:hypothetical protein
MDKNLKSMISDLEWEINEARIRCEIALSKLGKLKEKLYVLEEKSTEETNLISE